MHQPHWIISSRWEQCGKLTVALFTAGAWDAWSANEPLLQAQNFPLPCSLKKNETILWMKWMCLLVWLTVILAAHSSFFATCTFRLKVNQKFKMYCMSTPISNMTSHLLISDLIVQRVTPTPEFCTFLIQLGFNLLCWFIDII